MISGRGLGITGGTLDKLESIPGFKCVLSREQIIQQVQSVGCVICSQTDSMVPADKGLYALRDATGTVPSIPLITASILSKKLAEGISSLVLDVKFGSAAFMKDIADARQLADSMVDLANSSGVRTRALITNMNVPTGAAVGHWIEVKESVDCLEGRGPEDLRALAVECAAHLLVMESKSAEVQSARGMAAACLASRQPRDKFGEMLVAQGADLPSFNGMLQKDSLAAHISEVKAERDGYVSHCDARIIGEIVRDIGGGRMQKDAKVNPAVGIDRIHRVGQPIKRGELLCRIHVDSEAGARAVAPRVAQAFDVSDTPSPGVPLIHDVVG